MREKITLEKFRKLKESIINEIKILEKKITEYKDKESDEISFLRKNGQTLSELINELFSYDLSPIPFEEWQDMIIYSWDDEPLDLSQTHANIDFEILTEIAAMKGIIFKNCQIRNITSADPYNLHRAYFDEQVIAENPQLFLSSSFSDEFENKYIESRLELDDLINLTEEQIKELASKKNFRLNYKNSVNINGIISYFGLLKTINIYKVNPEYLPEVFYAICNINEFYGGIGNKLKSALDIESISEMMDKIDEVIAEYLKNPRFNVRPNLSERFKNKYPQLFIFKTELPEEIYKKYENNNLTIEDYIKYYNVFSKGNFLNHLSSVFLGETIDLIGQSTFLEIIGELSILFPEGVLPINIENYNFQKLLNDNLEQVQNNGENYNLKDIFYLTIVQAYYNDERLTFAKSDNPSVYDGANYPEWIKKMGIYLKHLKTIDDNYLSLITSSTTLLSVTEQRLINSLGLTNLLRFKNDYGCLGENLAIIAKYYNYNVEEPVTTYEEFLNRLANLFKLAFRNEYYGYNVKIIDELPEAFTSKYPSIFLSKDAPYELKKLYYTNDLSFQKLKIHSEWEPYFKKINLSGILQDNQPKLLTSLGKVNLVEYLYSIGAQDKINEYIWSYGNLLEGLFIKTSSLDTLTLDELDNIIIDEIYNNIKKRLEKGTITYAFEYDEKLPTRFKSKYPELFLSLDAPSELKTNFYAGRLTLNIIKNHPEWLPYLEGKTILNFADIPKYIEVFNSEYKGPQPIGYASFTNIYIQKYGLKSLLDFLIPYSSIFRLFKNIIIDLKNHSKEGIEKSIENSLYLAIIQSPGAFSDDLPESFKLEHPDIFLSANAPQDLKDRFYNCSLNYNDLCNHPEYLEYLKDIKFSFAFRGVKVNENYLNQLPEEIAYRLVSIFGNYIIANQDILGSLKEFKNFDQIDINTIKDTIVTYIKEGRMTYSEDVPQLIKQEIPHMFLSLDAPEDLKNYYYYNPNYNISFTILKKHPEWQPFLRDKSVLPFYYNTPRLFDKNIFDFIARIGGEKQFFKLGLQKPEDVDYMISNNKLDLLGKWYLKTGKKFIPDYTVMMTIPFEDADKFLANGKSWSTLMRSGNFKKTPEGTDALIKLAYCFGIFEGDPRAEKRLLSLISNLPRNLNAVDQNTIFQMEESILKSFTNPEETQNNMLIGLEEYKRIRQSMQKEGFNIGENEPILPLIYKVGEDGKCHLIINEQQYPETSKWIRNFMEINSLKGMITPQIAHTIFGGFILKYDPEFREFLLKNIDEILANPDYITYIAAVQKQFTKIRIDNSNRTLTLKLAVDYVRSNKYINVEIGNEELDRISAIAGYSQNDFDILQRIFNYGKLRTFSSIPRISSSNNGYSYEITRLIDAFPIAAGTLSDCCQELDNCAELDMEHSMTSKHGRLFVIRDEFGKIVAQSWVWRNQNVLCFDNVEIPDRAFERALKDKHLTSSEFAQIIYNIYVKASEELIATDEQTYKKLLEEGKITEEQYNSLKLSKVTVGLGYNDIANAIRANAKLDSEAPKLPPKYEAPVPLKRPLYLSDSRTQYVLSEKEGHIETSDIETPTVHYDEYQEYDKNTINSTVFKTLKHLEAETTNRKDYQLNCDIYDTKNAFTELAYNYEAKEDYLKLIVTPNFAIVYEETPSSIYILDLFANNKVILNNVEKDVTEEVYIQIKLALLQLQNKGKEIDTSRILNDVTDLYKTIDLLSSDFDEERGISRGTR